MNTPSHFLINLAIAKRRTQQDKPVHRAAFLLGSFLPDVPLFFLTLGYMAYQRWVQPGDESIFGPAYDALYFGDPWWIVGHNFLHAPFILVIAIAVGAWGMDQNRPWALWLCWFALGCAVHSGIDILTHHHDGPLLFFPFDWQTRFASPISYWDPDHFGRIFAPLELLFDLSILVWFVGDWWRGRREIPG